jgi:hypothetical protein
MLRKHYLQRFFTSFFFLSLGLCYCSPRRGCPTAMKFCMPPSVTKRLRLHSWRRRNSDNSPLPPPHDLFWGQLNISSWIRYVLWTISIGVDGGLRGGSIVCRPGSEDPHRRQRNINTCYTYCHHKLYTALKGLSHLYCMMRELYIFFI